MFSRKSLWSVKSISSLSFLLCVLSILSVSSFVQAQSGRRIPKKPPSSEPPASTSNEPEPESAKPKQEVPQTPVLVTRYFPNVSTSSIYTNVVMEGILSRLKDSSAISIRTGGDMNRKQASDAAKASQDTYVLWVELDVDVVDQGHTSSTIGGVDPRYLYVNYVLFSPQTGKNKSAGRVYQYNRRTGGLPLPGRIPGTQGAIEYSLKQMGRDTADRVLDSLGLPLPAERRY